MVRMPHNFKARYTEGWPKERVEKLALIVAQARTWHEILLHWPDESKISIYNVMKRHNLYATEAIFEPSEYRGNEFKDFGEEQDR